MEMRIPADR